MSYPKRRTPHKIVETFKTLLSRMVYGTKNEAKVAEQKICRALRPTGSKLGEGAFGAVYAMTVNGAPRAVKFVKKKYFTPAEARLAMGLATNPYVGKTYMHCQNSVYGIIVMETLFQNVVSIQRNGQKTCLLSQQNNRLLLSDALRLMGHLLQGLHLMHASNVAHRDIKHQNIMLDRDPATNPQWIAKYTDFGLACETSQCNGRPVGSPPFMPPEMIATTAKSSLAAAKAQDVWGVGMVLLETFVPQAHHAIGYPLVRSIDFLIDSTKPLTEMREIIATMLAPTAQQRCTATQALALFDDWLTVSLPGVDYKVP